MNELLKNINSPEDIKTLDTASLEQLSDEVRAMIIDCVSRTGGHLAANLGTVELTVALLKLFSPPEDKLIWDVSHQSYPYKILTGRRDRFETLRQYEGLSGFLRRDESEYDAFGAGHSGTALSAALGMAYARDQQGGDEHVIAIVGDASAGCGITFEAFNNLARATGRIIVVLNDNEMSIAENVGSISSYLGSLLANPRYNRYKSSVENLATRMKLTWLRSSYYKVEEAIKSLFLRSVIFEEFGLRYVGPINGHDIPSMIDALSVAKNSRHPILLHVSTKKGRGYTFAEKRPDHWHGTGEFDVKSGLPVKEKPGGYSGVFGKTLEKIAADDESVIAITAAMRDGTGLTGFAERFPDRFFDVGISEEHGAIFAAGLAAEGLKPVFAVYSTFFQRCIDLVIHDICLQNLPVVFCLDRAGIVGPDGPTHHGVFDLPLSCSVPNLCIMQPADESELANMIFTAFLLKSPVLIRYPKGGTDVPVPDMLEFIEKGKAVVVREPSGSTESEIVWIWALGDMIPIAVSASGLLRQDGIKAGVVNARFVKPLDEELLREHAADCRVMVTLENSMAIGGFGSLVEDKLSNFGFKDRVIKIGWPDEFVTHGDNAALFRKHGITAEEVAEQVKQALKESV